MAAKRSYLLDMHTFVIDSVLIINIITIE